MERDHLLWVGGLRGHSRINTWVLGGRGTLLAVFLSTIVFHWFVLLDVRLLHWLVAYRCISKWTEILDRYP